MKGVSEPRRNDTPKTTSTLSSWFPNIVLYKIELGLLGNPRVLQGKPEMSLSLLTPKSTQKKAGNKQEPV